MTRERHIKLRETRDDHICKLMVAIEGPDRVGKHTQARLLARRLQVAGGFANVGIIEAPIKDKTTHPRIYDMLRDGRAVKYPSTFQSLQILNRITYQQGALQYWMTKYDAFVFDRWNASSYAYGRAAGISKDEIMSGGFDLVGEPDLTIILDGKPFPKENLDEYEVDMEFQGRVRDGYMEWAREINRGRSYVIDANDAVTAVHEAVWHVYETWASEQDQDDNTNVLDLMPHIEARKMKELLKKQLRE